MKQREIELKQRAAIEKRIQKALDNGMTKWGIVYGRPLMSSSTLVLCLPNEIIIDIRLRNEKVEQELAELADIYITDSSKLTPWLRKGKIGRLGF